METKMALFFETQGKEFICPICLKSEKVSKKCFIQIRKRDPDPKDDMRKNLNCKSSSMCCDCYDKIEKFVVGLKKTKYGGKYGINNKRN